MERAAGRQSGRTSRRALAPTATTRRQGLEPPQGARASRPARAWLQHVLGGGAGPAAAGGRGAGCRLGSVCPPGPCGTSLCAGKSAQRKGCPLRWDAFRGTCKSSFYPPRSAWPPLESSLFLPFVRTLLEMHRPPKEVEQCPCGVCKEAKDTDGGGAKAPCCRVARAYQRTVGIALHPRSQLRRLLVKAPTGSGKTIMIIDLLNTWILENDRVRFLYLRKALIDTKTKVVLTKKGGIEIKSQDEAGGDPAAFWARVQCWVGLRPREEGSFRKRNTAKQPKSENFGSRWWFSFQPVLKEEDHYSWVRTIVAVMPNELVTSNLLDTFVRTRGYGCAVLRYNKAKKNHAVSLVASLEHDDLEPEKAEKAWGFAQDKLQEEMEQGGALCTYEQVNDQCRQQTTPPQCNRATGCAWKKASLGFPVSR